MHKNRKEFRKRALALFMLISILNTVVFPSASWALTTGPSQPEVQSFEPIGTSEMVDLFSGDFNYNIPLLDVDGYPVNISYHSGVGMDQEASWTGLGWNINPGVINRSMRGLPDDFKGELITKETNMKDNITVGVGAGFGGALAGNESALTNLHVGVGISYNNYVGIGIEKSLSLTFNLGKGAKGPLSGSLGFKSSNTDGLTISPSLSFSATLSEKSKMDETTSAKVGVGTSFNSRVGLKTMSISTSVESKWNNGGKRSNSTGGSSSYSFGAVSYTPQVSMPMKNMSLMFSASIGGTGMLADGTVDANGYFSSQRLETKTDQFPAYGYLYEQDGQKLDKVMLDFNREKDGEFSVNTPGLPLTNHTYDVYGVSGQGIGGSYRLHRSDVSYVFDSRASNTSDSYSLGAEISLGNAVQVGGDVTVSNVNTTSGKWQGENPLAAYLSPKGRETGPAYEPVYFKQSGEKTANIITNTPQITSAGSPESGYIPNTWSAFKKSTPVRASLEASTVDDYLYLTKSTITESFNSNETYMYYQNLDLAGDPNVVLNYTRERDKRTQEISYLKKSEDDFMLRPSDISTFAKNDHIAEISVLQPGGQRYVYGKALYNTDQQEVTFNVSGNDHCHRPDLSDAGYVAYVPGSDNSLNNNKGADHYFSRTSMPAYAHSYLLTSVLSPDYVDADNTAGPSFNDFGTYTLFEYQNNDEIYSSYFSCSPSSPARHPYKWRTPFLENNANYNENLHTKSLDDQGNYVYGEKEVSYLKYIKTKNFVAVFELNNPNTDGVRHDGWGVADKDGGMPSTAASSAGQSRYLKTISLYSRVDFEKKCADPSYVPFPIKQVHFEYDYSLCPGIENTSVADEGKLTLKKIYFTYGHSNKAKFSAYTFDYADINQNGAIDTYLWNEENPAYNMKATNRWGGYKPAPKALPGITTCNFNEPLSNTDFPYVKQDLTADADERIPEDYYSAAWSLTKIHLPSGGEISVDYESDDYAYVQDKNAMQMFKVVGTGIDKDHFTGTSGTAVLDGTNPVTSLGFFVDCAESRYNTSVSTQQTIRRIKQNYFKDMVTGTEPSKIYFRTFIKVNGGGNQGYEFVSGYAEVDSTTIRRTTDGTNRLFFKLKTVTLGKPERDAGYGVVNPLSQAAVNFGRLKTPREAFSMGGEPSPSASPQSMLTALLDANFLNTAIQTLMGPENYLFNIRGIGKEFVPSKTWFRLYNPYHDKLGGGSRVKKIMISDGWHDMNSPGTTSYYGQAFDYSTTETFDGIPMKVSSGVASYEPMMAGDENPFRQPVFSGDHKDALLAPDNRYYVEEPFGESLFPGASVGYSKVTVRSLNLNGSHVEETGVKRHATGYVVNEFFTARDYPIITARTDMDVKEAKTGLGGTILQFDVTNNMYASQGYVIEMNDMHGKPKATWVYGEGQSSPMSGMEYFYKDNGIPDPVTGLRNHGHKLENESIPVIARNGKYYDENTNMGIDHDFVVDFREEQTVSETVGAQLNLYVFYAVVPLAVPPVWPTYSKESVRLRTASLTKVINKYGIMDEVIAYDNGAMISSKNLLWDAETGEVLLNQTINEFGDPVYSFTYPAHWSYNGMGPAYINNMVEGTPAALATLLVAGDEVIADGTNRAWVNKTSGGTNLFIKKDGTILTPAYVKVIRSGRRNMQSVPVGNFTSLINPLLTDAADPASFPDNGDAFPLVAYDADYKILNASAVEFSDNAKIDCKCIFGTIPGEVNPYAYGLKGNWHPKTSYTFLTGRHQTATTVTNNPVKTGNMRKDGYFSTFTPFWTGNLSSGPLSAMPGTPGSSPYWTFASSLSIHSAYGHELENRDALNRYSAATYGYNNTLSISVSNNSQYKESGFDGFEDYDFNPCPFQHFQFRNVDGILPTTDRAHTGRYSYKVPAGKKISLVKGTKSCVSQEFEEEE
ncbi:MAG: hypothetical protein K0S33_3756 [Bacteroidetes bacterium]|jgi:hypothetical protein|nr:hypothetical protein [Bacteroidota bacterium]